MKILYILVKRKLIAILYVFNLFNLGAYYTTILFS